jgi:hypothetical protein
MSLSWLRLTNIAGIFKDISCFGVTPQINFAPEQLCLLNICKFINRFKFSFSLFKLYKIFQGGAVQQCAVADAKRVGGSTESSLVWAGQQGAAKHRALYSLPFFVLRNLFIGFGSLAIYSFLTLCSLRLGVVKIW